MEEMKAALAKNPNDTRTFHTFLEPILKGGNQGELDVFLAAVDAAVPDNEALSNLLRAADFKGKAVGGPIYEYLSYKVGKAFLDRMKNADMAEMYFRRLPATSPHTAELRDFYLDFYVKKENWRKLEQLFEAEAAREGAAAPTVEGKRKAARLARSVGNMDRALAYWQALRKEAPADAEALDELMTLYRETGKWHQVAEIVKGKADGLPKERAEEKVALLRELIPLYKDRLKMEAKVAQTYQEMLDLQPGNAEAFAALCGHFRENLRWPDLVKLLKARIAAGPEAEVAFELHREVAQVMEERFANATEAMRSFEAMLELKPQDLLVIRKLMGLYEGRRDFGKYVEVARRELAALSGAERSERLRKLAKLALENVREAAVGIGLWGEVRQESPEDKEAFDALMLLYERNKDFAGVAKLLEGQIERCPAGEKVPLLERLALLYGTKVGDMDQAAETWKRLLAVEGENYRARAELKKILVKAKDLENLEWFFQHYGTVNDYTRTLEGIAKEEEDPTLNVQLLFKLAGIYLEAEHKEEKAKDALEAVLAVEAQNVEAAQRLLPLYRTLNRPEELVRMQELLLAEKGDLTQEERLDLLLSKAQVHEEKLHQLDEAFFTYVQAYQLDWTRSDVHVEMERLAEASNNWPAYIDVLEQTLGRVDEDGYKVPYLLRIAEIWETKLGETEKSVGCYRQALGIDGTNVQALSALEGLYRKLSSFAELREVVQARLSVEQEKAERRRLLSELGRVCLENLEDAAGALAAYEGLVSEFPELAEGYDRMAQVLVREERFERLLSLLESKRQALPIAGEELADLLADIGMLRYGVQGEVGAACDAYVEALQVSGEHARAITLLEELVSDQDVQHRVACALEPVYQARGDEERLADTLEIQLAWVLAEEQVALLRRLAELYGRLSNRSARFLTLQRLVRLLPEDPQLKADLEMLAQDLDEWYPVVALYGEVIEKIGDATYRHEVMRATAGIYHERIKDRGIAKELYRAVLAEEAGDPASLAALQEIAIEEEDWEGLLALYETRKELEVSPEAKIGVMFEIADLCRSQLSDLGRASKVVEEILELDPSSLDALRLLDDLYTVQARWGDLMRALEQMAALSQEPAVEVELLLRMAELNEQKLANPQGMVDKIERALELDAANEKAVEVLERNIEGEIALQVLDLLERFMRRSRRYARLIDLMRLRIGLTEDAGDRVAIQKEVARIFEEDLEDKVAAFDNYRDALKLAPEDDFVLGRLQALTAGLSCWDRLFAVLSDQTAGMEEGPHRVKMWRLMAQVAAERLSEPKTAIEYYSKVVAAEPEDVDAVRALADLYRAGERWESLVATLDRYAELVGTLEDKKVLLLEQGDVYVTFLEQPEKAIASYERILELDGQDITALSNLESLYSQVEKWEELEQILHRRALLAGEGEERRALLLRRSEVLDFSLGRLDDAHQVLSELFAVDNRDSEVVERLEALHEKREDWLSLLNVLRHKLTLAERDAQPEILLKIAETYAARLSDIHQAVETYRELLSGFPTVGKVAEELERIVLGSEEKEEAYLLLKPLLEAQQEWERLLVCMEAYRESLEEVERRIGLTGQMTDVAELRLEDRTRAFFLAVQALEMAPGRGELADRLEGIGRAAGLLEQVVESYGAIAAREGNEEYQGVLLTRKAEVLKNEVQDFDRAIAEYEKLRELSPERSVLAALDELYAVVENWEKLASVLREEIDAAATPGEKMPFYFRLAELLEDRLGDAARACEVLKEAHLLDPQDGEALFRLRRVYDEKVGDEEAADLLESYYASHDQWEEAGDVLVRRFELSAKKESRLEIAQKLIAIYQDRLANLFQAHRYAGEALVLDPADEGTLRLLLALMEKTDMVETTVGFLERGKAEAEAVEAFRTLAMEAGRLYGKLARAEDAERCFKEVIGKDGEFGPAWAALEALYEEQKRPEDHERVLTRLIELTEYDDEKIPLLLKLGALRRDVLSKFEEATVAFEAVLGIDERNRPALDALAELYEVQGLYGKLAETLIAVSELTPETEVRVALVSRLADIYEKNLGDNEKAIAAWADVLNWRPADAGVLGNLERLYEVEKGWQSFVEVAQRHCALPDCPAERRVELMRRIAQVAGDELGEAMLAQTSFEAVRNALPADREAQDALRLLYRQNQDFMKLCALLAEVAGDEPARDVAERIGCWTELGQLKMEEVLDLDGAVFAWQQVVLLDPQNLAAFEALEKLFLDAGRFEQGVSVLRQKLALMSEPADRIALLNRVASIQEESMNRWQDAALTRLEILEIDARQLDQYAAVATLYESHEQWEPLAHILLRQLTVEEDERKIVESLTRVAQVFEDNLHDDKSAMHAVMRALEHERGSLELLDMAERIATRARLWDELYAAWSASVGHVEEEKRVELMTKLGALLRDRLQRYDEAITWFEKVAEAVPEDEGAWTALVELYELVENWARLADALDKLAGVTADFKSQVGYCLRLGSVRHTKLADSKGAQAAYRQVLELDPTEERAIEALQGLYSEAEDWEGLIGVLAMRASLHPEEDTQLKLISGDLLEEKLKQPLKAAELYEEVVAYDPTAADAFKRLVRIYTDHESWERLAETYDKMLLVTPEPAARVEVLRNLALLQQRAVGNMAAAADAWRQVLDMLPEDREALEALQRLYEELERYDELVLVLKQAVKLADSVRDRVALLKRSADVYAGKLEDLVSAVMCLREILENDPGHVETMLRLEELFAQQGDWMEVLKVLDLRIQVSKDTSEVVGFYMRKGEIYRTELLMLDKAVEQFHLALERDPRNEETALRLIRVYEEEENWDKVIEVLLAKAKAATSDEERARLFCTIGATMKERMQNVDGAIEVYEAALEKVSRLPEALSPLAEIYLEREQYEKAFPLLDMLKEKVEAEATVEQLAKFYRQMGRACLSVGKKDEALRYYQQAYDKDRSDLATLEALARLSMEQGNFEGARMHFAALLEQAGDGMERPRQISIYRALGEVEMNLGHSKAAAELLNRVIELSPNDKECLLDLAHMMEMHGDWNGVIEYRRKIVDLLTDPLEKWKVLISIGDAYREKLNDPEQAVAAYHEALDVQPYSKSALVKLLEIHIKSEAFGEAINVLQHLINIEENAQKKASFTFTIATIYRQHLNEPDASLEYYEQTLDLNAEKLEAFRAVDEVLTQKKAWEELEKAYRRMVNRVRGKGMKEIELTLYRGLGEIYRSRLKKLDLATSSFEMAVKLKMDDVHLHEILAQLYEVQGQREKAIAEHRALVILEPERVESYRRMAATFQEMGLPDDAWFATSVLAIFGRATTEERLAYQELKPTTLVPSTRSLDARLWVRTVFSKAQEVALGDIFQTLYQAVGPYLEGRDPKELGLRRKDEVDLREKTVFSTVLNRVSHLLGIPGPRVYLSERTFGIHVENTIPPVIVIGKDMMSGKSEIELAFQTGKCLAFFHPMHILAACYPAPVLKMFFQVALKYVHPDAVVEGGETEQFRQAAEMLSKRISPQFANALANDVDHYYKKQRKPSVSKWLTGVELTANHAGLLAAMDLEAAVSLLKGESIAISKLAPKEKVKELVLYAVSEEFAQARQALGLKL